VQREPVNYVDAMIAAARRLAAGIAEARTWIGHADLTENTGWRLAFLVEARRACAGAARELAALDERLTEIGKRPPPPLDRIAERTAAMAEELEALTTNIGELEEAAPPLGDA
jgi:hypothetical protein